MNVCMQERRESAIITHTHTYTYKPPSPVCLTRRVGYGSTKGKKERLFSSALCLLSLPLSLPLILFLFSSHIHSVISHAVVVHMFFTVSISSDYFNHLLWKIFISKWLSTSNTERWCWARCNYVMCIRWRQNWTG